MEEENKNNRLWKFFEDWGWLILVGIAGLIAYILNRKTDPYYSERVLKSDLAKTYSGENEVSVELMMNWAKLFFPEDIRSAYVGEKIQKVRIGYFHKHLGKPEERPKTDKGIELLSKENFSTAFFMDRSTLRRKIQKIENPEIVIGMSYEVYKSLKTFPPKQARLIYNHLQSERKAA